MLSSTSVAQVRNSLLNPKLFKYGQFTHFANNIKVFLQLQRSLFGLNFNVKLILRKYCMEFIILHAG